MRAETPPRADAPRWQFGLGRENALIFWGLIFLEASFGSFFALWPLWIEELGAPVTTVGLLLGLGGVLRLFVLLPSAWLARRYGIRRTIVSARLISAAGIALAAAAQHWTWLFPTLLGMAVGELAFPLVATAVAANAGEQRVRAFAIVMTTGPSIALLVTPLLSGALVSAFGLRAPFVAATVFTLLSVGFFAQLHDEPPVEEVVPAGARGGYRGLLQAPGLPFLFTLQFLTFFSIGLGTSLLSIYLHEEHGYAESLIPPLTALTALGSIAAAQVVTRSARLTAAPLIAVAGATASAGIATLLFLRADLLPIVLLAMTLRGGFFTAWPLFTAALGEAAGERLRPHAFALGEILAGTGFVISPVLAGQLYDLRPELPLLASASMIALLVPIIVWRGRAMRDAAVTR